MLSGEALTLVQGVFLFLKYVCDDCVFITPKGNSLQLQRNWSMETSFQNAVTSICAECVLSRIGVIATLATAVALAPFYCGLACEKARNRVAAISLHTIALCGGLYLAVPAMKWAFKFALASTQRRCLFTYWVVVLSLSLPAIAWGAARTQVGQPSRFIAAMLFVLFII